MSWDPEDELDELLDIDKHLCDDESGDEDSCLLLFDVNRSKSNKNNNEMLLASWVCLDVSDVFSPPPKEAK